MMVVYKITHPSGRIYVGQGRTDTLNYFGRSDGWLFEHGFTQEQRRYLTIREETLGSQRLHLTPR